MNAARKTTPPPGATQKVVSVKAEPSNGQSALNSAAVTLLKLEGEIRDVRSRSELAYLAANEPRSLLRAQQIIIFSRGHYDVFYVKAVSSVTHVDRSSPLILWFEGMIAALEREFSLTTHREFESSAFSGAFDSARDSYPLRNLLWLPWLDRNGKVVGGMLLARSVPWQATEISIGNHLARAIAHTWVSLARGAPWRFGLGLRSPRLAAAAALAAAVALAFPVSMAALAPVEVSPKRPAIVSSGVEGVVQAVLVAPNQPVKKDQVLLQMADTVFRNRLEIAEREVAVAETKYKKASQMAFADARGRHELALAQAELSLKLAERDYARDLLDRSQIKAERDGIAFFADTKDLIGRPVAVGEKLMEIADPKSAQFHVDLPVSDAIVLTEGARVKVFLDSDPLNPVEARLVTAGYHARMTDSQQLAFRIVAEPLATERKALRLGVRGTAQVYSDRVPLGFYLFRRPIAAARQWLGI